MTTFSLMLFLCCLFLSTIHWYKMSPLEVAFTSTYIFCLYAYFSLKKPSPRPSRGRVIKKLLFYILIVCGCFNVENKVDSIFLGGLWCPKGTFKFYGDGALKNVPFSRTFLVLRRCDLKIRQVGNAVPSPEKGLWEEKNSLRRSR